MKHTIFCFLLFMLVFTGFGAAAAAGELVIAGTGDSQVLLRQLSTLYERLHPASRIIVPDSVGSGGGIKAVIKGAAGLGRTARPMKPKEQGNGLTEIPFALSPIVFAAHPSAAGILDITSDQVIGIYNGTIRNWQKLGGDDHKIYPVDREHGDSSRTLLEKRLKSPSLAFKDIQSIGKVFFSTPETASAITRHPHTIGYLPLSMAQEKQLHILSLDGVFPPKTSLQTRDYPLVAVFYLVKPADPSRIAEDFLEFIQADEARQLMTASGIIPINQVQQLVGVK